MATNVNNKVVTGASISALKSYIDSKVGTGGGMDMTPVGSIMPYLGTNLPSGWFLCNGGSLSKTAYPALFAVIGYKYGGSGDNFNLPNLNGRFLEGSESAGTYKSAGIPNITGKFTFGMNGVAYWDAMAAEKAFYADTPFSDYALNFSTYTMRTTQPKMNFDASRVSPVYNDSTTVQPNSLTVRYIIKAFNGESTVSDATIDAQVALNTERIQSLMNSNSIYAHGGNDTVGYYIQFVDGTQICYRSFAVSKMAVSTVWGSIYESSEKNMGAFPLAFVSPPSMSVHAHTTNAAVILEFGGCSAQNAGYAYLVRATAFNAQEAGITYVAVGRWK